MKHEPLNRAMEAAGVTQKQVAAGIHMDPGQFSRIVNGSEALTPAKAAAATKWFSDNHQIEISVIDLLYPGGVAEVAAAQLEQKAS